MSPSSDIETLFGHFGGNAADYQEIGRENEASTARTRWPLLVTLDLKQPSIPAIPKRRDPVAKPDDEATQAQAPGGDAPAANGPAEAGRATAPRVRSKMPVFARPHRRTIPPVGNAVKSEAPRGAERFSAVAQAANAELAASDAEPGAVHLTVTPPVVAPTTFSTPTVRAPAPSTQGFAASATPAFATRVAMPVSAHAQPASAAFTARATAPAAPSAPAVQPASILGKLFKPAAPSTAPAARTPAADAAPAALSSLFDRLRGETSSPATPAPHSWLTNGPRRP
jgi:hypothetical protein